jgi:hypothetical protein
VLQHARPVVLFTEEDIHDNQGTHDRHKATSDIEGEDERETASGSAPLEALAAMP